MVISLKRLAEWAKFLMLFLILTLVMYQVIALLSQWMKPAHRYGEPKGRAVKVFAPYEPDGRFQEDASVFPDRLLLFYWLGE
jgi:hypothetical protein